MRATRPFETSAVVSFSIRNRPVGSKSTEASEERRNASIPDVPTAKEQGFDIAPLSIGGLLTPAGLPADIKNKLEAACLAVKDSEPFQRIVKSTFQPSDYFADAAGFAANLAKDVTDKKRLLTALGMVKN